MGAVRRLVAYQLAAGWRGWAVLALSRELGPRYQAFDADYVKLRPGVTPSAFGHEAQAPARRFPGTGGQVFVAEAVQAAAIDRAI